VFSSAELIEFLRRRARRSLRPEEAPGEFPPGWRAWFAAMRERIGRIRGASADAIVAILAARALRRPPRRSPQLNTFQAFAALLRQQWQPIGPEDRWQRIAAFSISAFMQLVFALFVLWLAYARYGGAPTPVQEGEDVVQVEFIGEGTPEEQGGGEPAGPQPDPQPARTATRAPAPDQARSSPPAPAPAEPVVQPEPQPPAPQPPAPVAVAEPAPPRELPTPPEPLPEPPLQATEVPEPDIDFVVPPVTAMQAVQVPRSSVEVPQLRRDVQALPSPAPALPSAVAREVQVRAARVQVPGLQREVGELPAAAPPLPGVQAREAGIGQAQVSVPGLTRSVASLPSPEPAEGEGEGQGAEASAAPASGATVPGAGAGPESDAVAGAWSTLTAGDDWGESDRNRDDGGQRGASGIFDEQGRPRLPPGAGATAGDALPPGVVFEDIQDLDRAGTWRKRPPIDYKPTAFDRYWMPGGTLLEEWVRRGIREVQIAIPGTSKKIRCVVSLLQLGGGCGITDPDMQDQEAEARPPPDVPWKPELQEN
jgi:hypothetical protein